LKIRQCAKETVELVDPKAASTIRVTVECEQPNNRLYVFEGLLLFICSCSCQHNAVVGAMELEGSKEKISLSNTQVLLRGCIVRNTPWVIGVVVFTGQLTTLDNIVR
jgi:magnesium-transporting ATPase (P-type)